MKGKNKFLSALSNLDIIVASIILVILIALTFLGVVSRRVFNAPFTWLEEVQLACMVWIVYAAGGAAFRTGNHVAIEMLVDLLPKKLQKIMEVLITVVVFFVIGYLIKYSLGFIELFLKSGRSTSILKIPYYLIYGIAPVSYVLMIVSYLYSVVVGVKSEVKEAAEVDE